MNRAAVALAETAPAKINLALHVTGQRPDGYHLLESLVVFTALGDRLAVTRSSADAFSVEGAFAAGIPTDAANLVIRARDLLRRRDQDSSDGPVGLTLVKNLPMASGIGGGSSDAAATLRSLNRLWKRDLSRAALAELGKSLGADVPMCVFARPLIAKGIGDAIDPLPGFPVLNLVLVNPGVAVQTPAVFTALASRTNPPLPAPPARPGFAALLEWLQASRNDLEAPAMAIAPAISEALAALRANGAAFVRMSGSGATCFGLFGTKGGADAAATKIRHAQPDWFVEASETLTGEDHAGN